jgi:protein O-mannosyl-transferase
MPPGRALPLQIRQVAARRKLSLPTPEHERPRAITWRRPTYRMVLSMVRSPFYAAAWAFMSLTLSRWRVDGMRGPDLTSNRLAQWAMAAGVAAVTMVTFTPALRYGFVYWDDNLNFLANPHYRGFGRPQLRWIWTTFHMGHYIPLTWTSLALDYVLWGMNPAGYHLTSVLLHTTNALLFYLIAERLLKVALSIASADSFGLRLGAAASALFFAVHPLRVESVVWISERRDVLAGFFYLLTILFYLHAVGRSGDATRVSARWYMGALASFTLALLSKATAASLPIVLLILDVYPLRCLGGSWRAWTRPEARSI